ncbi:hypothetical protein Aduo_005074 [Ancylostoma duodenale]
MALTAAVLSEQSQRTSALSLAIFGLPTPLILRLDAICLEMAEIVLLFSCSNVVPFSAREQRAGRLRAGVFSWLVVGLSCWRLGWY